MDRDCIDWYLVDYDSLNDCYFVYNEADKDDFWGPYNYKAEAQERADELNGGCDD